MLRSCLALFLCLLVSTLSAASEETLPGTRPLLATGDLSLQMREGFDRFLTRELERSVTERQKHWKRDFTSRAAYETSVEPNRARLKHYTGAVDPRQPIDTLEEVSTLRSPARVAETPRYTVTAVRWEVLPRVFGTGLLVRPKGKIGARVIALPDADQTPEMLVGLAPGIPAESQFARRLAENGCEVVVPVLIDRKDTWSGNPAVTMTNQTHREWIYRQAYQMGRHLIGYEVQKVLSLVDWFRSPAGQSEGPKVTGPKVSPSDSPRPSDLSTFRPSDTPLAVAGYGEGGLIALYSAAMDTRIDGALVSGYFGPRQEIWEEPLYRNVFGLLHEFGDAEIASLVAPRPLVVEYSRGPEIDGPPAGGMGRLASAAPGRLRTRSAASVRSEVDRFRSFFPSGGSVQPALTLIEGGGDATVPFGSETALVALLEGVGAPRKRLERPGAPPTDRRPHFSPNERMQRQVTELVDYNQHLMRQSVHVRKAFWSRAKGASPAEWAESSKPYRETCWDELIGRFPAPTLPANPRSRKILDRPKWTGYEVMLDVYPDVFCWGYLLVPKDLKPGERRPVVVTQHGLEGVPADVLETNPSTPAYSVYKGFATALADRGFVVYAPHNFYRGGNQFRQLQRKANPLKNTLFGITTRQHERHLEWLSSLPFVDPERIGFYGLSYGGNTAVRVPAILEKYACVIASGDFNEWVFKNVGIEYLTCFSFLGSYEVFEWNLGHTFDHSELASLVAPRPFMVERGHHDTVALDEWVAWEYAKVRRLYAQLGIPARTEIEFFNGPHTINGQASFEFLHRHLRWPAPQ